MADPINGTKQQEIVPLQIHYVEALDSLANIAKATRTYTQLVNAVLTVTAIVLSETTEEEATRIIAQLTAQSSGYREQHNARIAAAADELNQTKEQHDVH